MTGEGEAQKREAIDKFKNSATAGLVDVKAIASAYNPYGLQGKLPANWVPRLAEVLGRSAGPYGAILGVGTLGALGYLWNKKRLRNKFNEDIDKMASYSVEHIWLGAPEMTKVASAGLDEVRTIMKKVYEEDPSYWPYGLDVSGHESLYLIRDNMTKQAAGFVGWQEQRINGRKIGSYSIGVLPEYRSKGFAKEAVAKILMEKAARVDEVRSYVCPHNFRSKGLAGTLGVKVHEKF